MSKHSKLDVLVAMRQIGLIPVFYNGDIETAKNIVSASADGGARVVEFTNRADRAINIFHSRPIENQNMRVLLK